MIQTQRSGVWGPNKINKPRSNHFAAGMMWRINPNTSDLEFLIIEYREGNKAPTYKFPGGTNRISWEPLLYRDESPLQTLAGWKGNPDYPGEWHEEVGQRLTQVFDHPSKFEGGRPGSGHFQFFFLIRAEWGVGPIRTTVYVEKEEGRADEVLGPPMWVSASKLRSGCRYELFKNHLLALEQALEGVKRAMASES